MLASAVGDPDAEGGLARGRRRRGNFCGGGRAGSRLAARIEEQFPIFRDIAIQEHRGGLPTMTANGEHILGPWPGLNGIYVIGGGCVGGLSIVPILGDLLATWITSGSPGLDLSALAPGRTAVAALDDASLTESCRCNYAYHYWARGTRPLA